MLVSDKTDFKSYQRQRGTLYIINQKFNTARKYNINIDIPNDRSSKYMKQKQTKLKREIDSSTIIVGRL